MAPLPAHRLSLLALVVFLSFSICGPSEARPVLAVGKSNLEIMARRDNRLPLSLLDHDPYLAHDSTMPLSRRGSSSPEKKKKKKKKKGPVGPPPVRLAAFRGPRVNPQSVPGFSLTRLETPWRHRMTYSLEWTLSHPLFWSTSDPTRPESPGEDPKVRGKVSMDIFLVPLDPAKTNELLMTRVPIESLWAQLQIRTEVAPGWYRLLIEFWDSGQVQETNGGAPDTIDPSWDLFDSKLVSSPGIPKVISPDTPSFYQPRRLGSWRGEDAIEVTGLEPHHPEWTEFLEIVSNENQQGKMAGQSPLVRQERQRATREAQLAEQEFRVGQGSGRNFGGGSSFQRSLYPQESFRFKKAMAVMVGREMAPDFQEDELEEEGERTTEQDKDQARRVKEHLAEQMATWQASSRGQQDDDGMDQDEEWGRPPAGLSDLGIRIEHGKEIVSTHSLLEWRSNRDRTLSWSGDALGHDQVLLTIDLIQTPEAPIPAAARTKSRAEVIQRSIEAPRVALLTDRIPGSWGAMVVRMPSWIQPGSYQVRLSGMGQQGVRWADVSQPFAVVSDPYLYKYATHELQDENSP